MKWYSLREAAEALGIKVRTVREWVRLGKIEAEKDEGGWRWKIKDSEIRRLSDENKD